MATEYLERLAELKAVRAKATPGHLAYTANDDTVVESRFCDLNDEVIAHGEVGTLSTESEYVGFGMGKKDGEFLATAANEWDALIDSNRVLREALEKYRHIVWQARMEGPVWAARDALAAADALLLGKGRE